MFATFSVICTVTLSCILFPIAIKALGSVAINLLNTYLPQLMPIITQYATAIWNVVQPICAAIAEGAPYAELVGLGLIIGAAVTVIGTPISVLIDKFKDWWHKPAPVGKEWWDELSDDEYRHDIEFFKIF